MQAVAVAVRPALAQQILTAVQAVRAAAVQVMELSMATVLPELLIEAVEAVVVLILAQVGQGDQGQSYCVILLFTPLHFPVA
jgi:hypothetical protein